MSIHVVNELDKIAKDAMRDDLYLRSAARDLENSANDFANDYVALANKMKENKLEISDLQELKREIKKIIE